MQRLTMKDIARIAGVSVTTVSRALNDAPEMSRATKDRVLAICREEGYRANLLARSLISSRSNVIGVVLPDLTGPFHAALALHIETLARERGYQVMLCNGRPEDVQVETLFGFLVGQRVDGILLTSASNEAHELLDRYAPVMPSVLLGDPSPTDTALRVNAVSTDNYMGGRIGAEYLFRLGHRDVAYLGPRRGSVTHALRHQGFLSAAQDLGMRVHTLENPGRMSTLDHGYRLGRALFSAPFTQTAVFAPSDIMALGVMQAADEAGLRIPQDISLLGYDDIEYAALPKIRLTTIAQPTAKLAAAALELLLALIGAEDRAGDHTHRLLMPALVERDTCRKL